jgi:hypothetical protein
MFTLSVATSLWNVFTARWGSSSKVRGSITMTSQSRKHRGYKTQRNVALYLSQFWPYAQSVGAGQTGSDILNTPFDIEVKARTGFNPSAVLKQLKARSSGRLGLAVLRLNGQGDNAEDYAVVMRLADFMELVIRCNKCGSWQELYGHCQTCLKDVKK